MRREYAWDMSADAQLFVVLGAMHLITLALAGVLIAIFLRADTGTPWRPPADGDDDGGGGGGGPKLVPPTPPRPSGGGLPLPLPDAVPARARLREAGRIGTWRPERRREHAPGPPRRVPQRAG